MKNPNKSAIQSAIQSAPKQPAQESFDITDLAPTFAHFCIPPSTPPLIKYDPQRSYECDTPAKVGDSISVEACVDNYCDLPLQGLCPTITVKGIWMVLASDIYEILAPGTRYHEWLAETMTDYCYAHGRFDYEEVNFIHDYAKDGQVALHMSAAAKIVTDTDTNVGRYVEALCYASLPSELTSDI